MRMKTEYGEFVHKIEDAEFTLKETDIAQYSSGAVSVGANNEMKLDSNAILAAVLKDCLLGWKNVVDEKDVDLICNETNKDKLPYSIKLELFTAIQEKSSLPIKKKES